MDDKPQDHQLDDGIDLIANTAHQQSNDELEHNRAARDQVSALYKGPVRIIIDKPSNNDIDKSFRRIVDRVRISSFSSASELTAKKDDRPLYTQHDMERPADFRGSFKTTKERKAHSLDSAGEPGKIIHSIAFRRLQGKMQLFPPSESPLLRNRLTHSIEVSDIAVQIANYLNSKRNFTGTANRRIDTSIVQAAGLAHDLGHPPFGHSGEVALAKFIYGFGSYEGNAQTLRIVTRLENRFTRNISHNGVFGDVYRDPVGLNLNFRTLAAVIKYDKIIPDNFQFDFEKKQKPFKPPKGYYEDDVALVRQIKRAVLRNPDSVEDGKFRTLECSIMDIADDIAYSTYDLEDCFISGELTPLDMLAVDRHTMERICDEINNTLASAHGQQLNRETRINSQDVVIIFAKIFDSLIRFNEDSQYNIESMMGRTGYVASTFFESKLIANDQLYRRRLTETLIRGAVRSVLIDRWNAAEPTLSRVRLSTKYLILIEALKHFNYWKIIESPRLQTYNARAETIILGICNVLFNDRFCKLLPEGVKKHWYNFGRNGKEIFDYVLRQNVLIGKADNVRLAELVRKRMICDYVSSLTDNEATTLFAKMMTVESISIFGVQS